MTVGGYQVKYGFLGAPQPPGSGWITRMDVDVVDGPGPNAKQVPISRLMLHHIVFVNLAHRDATCNRITSIDSVTSLPGAERMYGAGEERAKLRLPQGYGYGVGRHDPWALTYMFMNHRPTVDTAYVRYRVTYDTNPAL